MNEPVPRWLEIVVLCERGIELEGQLRRRDLTIHERQLVLMAYEITKTQLRIMTGRAAIMPEVPSPGDGEAVH